MGWIGTEAAENQCEQACEEARKSRENTNTKRKERIRRRSENSKKVGYRSKWKGWPKEKGLLDNTHTHTHTHTPGGVQGDGRGREFERLVAEARHVVDGAVAQIDQLVRAPRGV